MKKSVIIYIYAFEAQLLRSFWKKNIAYAIRILSIDEENDHKIVNPEHMFYFN